MMLIFFDLTICALTQAYTVLSAVPNILNCSFLSNLYYVTIRGTRCVVAILRRAVILRLLNLPGEIS